MTDGRRKNKPAPGRRKGAPRGWRERILSPFGLALAVVVVLGLIAAFLTGRGGGNTTANAGPQTAPVQVKGSALTPYDSSSATDPAVGKPAPELTGHSLFDGKPLTFTANGRPRVVIFVAHWCPHCQREVPTLKDWFDSHPVPSGLDVETVSTSVSSQRPNYPPETWLKKAGWTFPVMADDDQSSAAQAYGLSAFPFFVFVDANGAVVQRISGELPPTLVQQAFDALAKGHTASDGTLINPTG